MAIPLTLSEVPNVLPYIQYVATAGQTVFPYPFPITQDSDLVLVYNGTTEATDSIYTLSGQGNGTGGNLTLNSGATAGDILTLYRDIPIERLTQIGQNSGFSSTAFNAEFNNLYLIAQQLEDSIAFCLRVPNTNYPAPVTTLTPAAYANKYLAFDAYGNPEAAALTPSGSITESLVDSLFTTATPSVLATFAAPTAITAAEIAASVIPTNYQYPAYPYVDPRRYGADPTGVADSTVAVQTAINIAYAMNGAVWIGNQCNYLVGNLLLTVSGTANRALRIFGSSLVGSALTAKPGITGALLTFTSGAPASSLVEAFIRLDNFSIYNAGAITAGNHGLSIQGCASWRLSSVRVSGFDRGLDLQSALIGQIDQGCQFVGNNTGIRVAIVGTTYSTNLIRIEACRITLNAQWGVDYNGGTEIQLVGNDIEANGTPENVTFAKAPAPGSTTAPALTGVWAFETHVYAIRMSTGQVVYALLTNGSTVVGNFNVAITGTPTVNAVTGVGGGFVARGQISPGLLQGTVQLDSNWFELNNGTAIYVAAPTNNASSYIRISGGTVLSTQNGNAINIQGASSISIEDLPCGATDIWNLNAGTAFIKNCAVATIYDSGISIPTYIGLQLAAGFDFAGRLDSSVTLALTGVSTATTIVPQIYQQGDRITMVTEDLVGASNSTAATITGLPAQYAPANNTLIPCVVENAGVDSVQYLVITGLTGAITLTQAGSPTGFTSTGSKGLPAQNISWHL